jgi:putative ABC transport system permease protein
MFHNYLITALRNFTRHKLYSFINIAGLTVGLACAIFIILFVRDELSYDKWIPGTENLYRVEVTWHIPGQPPMPMTLAPFVATEAMLAQIPEVKAIAHLEPWRMTVAHGDHQFTQVVDVVNSNFFQVIKLPLEQGNPADVLTHPESAVISAEMARKLFGTESAVGKMITVSGGSSVLPTTFPGHVEAGLHPLLVSGVFRDLPYNTQLAGDVFIPNTSKADPMDPDFKQSWDDTHGWGFVDLAPGAQPSLVLAKLRAILDRSFDPAKVANIHMRGSQMEEPRLTLFQDDHLSTDRNGSLTPPGSWTTVLGFIAIGVLILLVACFNFTNLATARATVRAREISLRKVMGARRRQLAVQFLGESVLMAGISLLLALSLAEILLPAFDGMLNKPIQFLYSGDWKLVLALIGVAIIAGLIGGAYPALVLSGLRPVNVLRTNQANLSGSGLVRTLLVILQFAVSIGLAIAVIVLFEQISFARNVDLGFRKDDVVVLHVDDVPVATRESLIEALRRGPAVEKVALSGIVPFVDRDNNLPVKMPGSSATELMRSVVIGPDFLSVYHIPLLAGRQLSDSHGQDQMASGSSYNVLVNETAAKRFGKSPKDAIGKVMIQAFDSFNHATISLTIVGVVADFKIAGTKAPVTATLYRYIPQAVSYISIRLRPGQLPTALPFIDQTWRSFAPLVTMQRFFLTQSFDSQFANDEKQENIFVVFVGIAIFIACLGLFGLAAFSTERRTKEIGLRKTFGARTKDIILLLLWQFSIPVLVANLIAWPVAYYYLHHWLEGYAYRISLNPLYFIGAGLAALIIACATVFVHAQRVARANPIHALRYE